MLRVKLKPDFPKYYLLVTAGLIWNIAGFLLCWTAYQWLAPLSWHARVSLGMTGIVLSLPAYRYVFKKIARKNIGRLGLLPAQSCLFAFQAWKSYLLIAVMITLGIFLRHSPVPKSFLSVIYLTIGGALIFGGIHYFKHRFIH